MPMIRYQVRNEYGLADPELYRASGRDDPEALLEGVAMAGLVGVLRQLGDLAEFAAEIFRELHEEVMATAARGHGLMVRVQQLEAEFPSIEKAFFCQTSHSHFAHNAGIDWHANLHIDQNLITRGDMPRFILDSYEECRGPPRLFMLDKFDIAGAGTCLKRYSDPSFFKMELASSGTMEEEVQREKKVRKIKKKVSHWKNDEVEFSLAPRINSNLQPEIPEQAPGTKPTRRVKLKSRHLTAMDTSSRRSYMESLLEVHSAEQEVQLENSLSQTNIKMESIKSAPEVHEILVDNLDKYPSFSEKKTTQPPTKQITEAPTNGLENQKIKGEEILEILPQSFEGVQKMYIDYQVVVKKETSAQSENKTERSDISYRSSDAENYTPAQLVSQNTLLDDVQCITEDFAEVSRPDDIGSEADSFMDALNIMESEIETDSESRAKSDAGLFSMESQVAPFNNNKGQQELLAHFSGPDPVENSLAQLGLENIQDEGMPSVSISNKLGNLDYTQPSLQKMIGFDVNAYSEACPGDTQDTSSEKLWGNGEAMKLKSQVNFSDGTCHDKASAIPNSRSEIGEASSDSCVSDLTCAIIHLCPEGSFDQAQLVTSDSNEISSCDVKSDDKGTGHLDGNATCAAETSEASQLNGSPLRSRYLSGETHHPPEHVEALILEDIAVVVDIPNPIFPKKDGRILELFPTGYVDDTEGCSGGIISRTASSCYPEISSTIGPDGLAAETKNVMQPEDLAGETSPGCVTGIYEVVEHLDGNAPCAAETSEASQLNGSPLRSRYLSGETHHPPEHVEELISEDIAVVVDVPNPIFPKKDGSILEQLPTGYVDDTEGCSGGIISRTASYCYPEISSTIGPDGLAAETKNVMQPEDLAGEISPGCVTGIYKVVEHLDGNAPCAAETSKGSLLRSRYLSGETRHPLEHVEELISEDTAVVVDVPNPIFPKKDGHILELPTDYVDDTEGCSGGIISRTASSHYPEIRSTVVGPDGLAAETENVMQPEDLAAEISPGFVTGIYEVSEHLDGLHTGGIDVRKNAYPSEDDEELNSSQIRSTTLLEEPSAGYIEDFPRSLTLQLGREPQELIERDTEYISPVTSHITMQPAGLAVETENSVAPDEELECSQSAGGLPNTEEIVESEILLPHILPLDVEPREFRDAESAEFAPSFSGKETVPDDVQLQSNSEVIDGPVPVGDYLRLSFEYTDLHSNALQIEQHIQCDDSLIKSVTDKAVIDYHETSSQEDCVPSDTDLNQYNFDITEPSSPNNRTESYSERALCTPLSPQDESLPISASAVSSSEFFNQDLSDSSDARLFNGIYDTMPSEHLETDLSLRVVEEIPFYSLETGEDFSSRVSNESVKEGISSSLEEAPKAHAGDESNEMSSYQEAEHLEPSDLQFEITQSVDQNIIQSNSVESSDLGSEADSHIMIIDQNISELDIRSSNTWQLEPEAAAPSEFSYEQSVIPSLNSSAAGLPLFASFGLAISESTPEQVSETQISDTVSSFQLQDLHETPPLPPLPPLEWRLVKARPGCLTSDGNLVQPLAGTNPFMGVSVEAEIVAPLPPLKDNRSQCGLLGLHNEKVWPLRLSELPPIVKDEGHQYCIQEEAVHSTDPSVLVSPIEDDKHLHSHWQPSNPFLPLQSPEDGFSRHLHRLPVEKIQPSEDKGPQLVQLPPSLEVERSQRGNLTIEREIMQSTSPFFTESSVEDETYRYNYGAYGAENMQHLNWSAPLLTSGPMMQHHGLISSVDENPVSPYDDSVPSSGDEKPNGKLRSIRNLPRHPLIDAVAAHDKSKLRKVSELVQPSTRPKADERDTLLEQIRSKCFNLKPAAAMRPNIKGPPTNLKVAAILEKANAIRQACVGSDEDDDNGDGWSDS